MIPEESPVENDKISMKKSDEDQQEMTKRDSDLCLGR